MAPQVGDFVDLCLHLSVHVGSRTHESPIRGPLEPKMLPKCGQYARAEGHEMRALLIRNPLFRFRYPRALGSLLTPYLGPIFHPSWSQAASKRAQVGPKLAPSSPQVGPKIPWKRNTKQDQKITPTQGGQNPPRTNREIPDTPPGVP